MFNFIVNLSTFVKLIVNFLIHVWLASYYNFVIFPLKLIDRKGEQGESVQSIGSIDRIIRSELETSALC